MVAAAQFLGDFIDLRRRVKSPQSRGIGAHTALEWDLPNLAFIRNHTWDLSLPCRSPQCDRSMLHWSKHY